MSTMILLCDSSTWWPLQNLDCVAGQNSRPFVDVDPHHKKLKSPCSVALEKLF